MICRISCPTTRCGCTKSLRRSFGRRLRPSTSAVSSTTRGAKQRSVCVCVCMHARACVLVTIDKQRELYNQRCEATECETTLMSCVESFRLFWLGSFPLCFTHLPPPFSCYSRCFCVSLVQVLRSGEAPQWPAPCIHPGSIPRSHDRWR